jgi:hypothetical protein
MHWRNHRSKTWWLADHNLPVGTFLATLVAGGATWANLARRLATFAPLAASTTGKTGAGGGAQQLAAFRAHLAHVAPGAGRTARPTSPKFRRKGRKTEGRSYLDLRAAGACSKPKGPTSAS